MRRPTTAWASALQMAGDMDGAIETWKKAVELKPEFDFPLYNLGLGLLGQGDKAEALTSPHEIQETSPTRGSPSADKEKLDELIGKCR